MKVSIIGCGWLGLPLGKHLASNGHEVIGSTTAQDKFKEIRAAGIQPVLLKLAPMPIGENFNTLFDSEAVIINIPPGRKTNTPEFYAEQIKYLTYLIDNSNVKRIIFISSTSYYPNTNSTVKVDTRFDFEKGSSKAVVWGEREIKKSGKELLVLRCGGLMGENRIPGKWFSGKETKGADTPVNYIHRDEIIKVIESELAEQYQSEKLRIKNLVSPHHPSRRAVHLATSKRYGFEPPQWVEPHTIPHKVVASDFSEMDLRSPVDY